MRHRPDRLRNGDSRRSRRHHHGHCPENIAGYLSSMPHHQSEYDDAEPSLVRPYALTEGRTLPSIDLPLEAIIATIENAVPKHLAPQDIRASIAAPYERSEKRRVGKKGV